MTETNKTPEAQEKTGGEIGAEQNVPAEQPQQVTPPEPVQQERCAKEISKDARMWAMFCHLAGLAGIVIPVVGNIVTPLVIWQIKKDDFPFVDEQGKEAVNFQISMSLYGLIASVACLITCVGAVLIPLVVVPAVYIVDLVFLLIAAVKANNGHHYRYPLTIRFIK